MLLHTLSVKELPRAVVISCMVWELLSISVDSLAIILLSAHTCNGSEGLPGQSCPSCSVCISVIQSAAEVLLPQADHFIKNGWCHHRVIKDAQECSLHWCLSSPVNCSGERPGTRVHLSQCPFHGCWPVSGASVYHQLLSLPFVGDGSSGTRPQRVVSVAYEANNCTVIRERFVHLQERAGFVEMVSLTTILQQGYRRFKMTVPWM